MKALLKFFFRLIVVAAIFAVAGRLLLFQIARTDSFSMIPALVPGDYFLVYTRGALESGEIAICRNPEKPGGLVVLRVLATPGVKFSIHGNTVKLNDNEIIHTEVAGTLDYIDNTAGEQLQYTATLAHEYVGGHEFFAAFSERGSDYNFSPKTVETGLFLVGDNRNRSRDSRHFGEVPIKDCLGQAIMVLWPTQDSGELKKKDRILEWLL